MLTKNRCVILVVVVSCRVVGKNLSPLFWSDENAGASFRWSSLLPASGQKLAGAGKKVLKMSAVENRNFEIPWNLWKRLMIDGIIWYPKLIWRCVESLVSSLKSWNRIYGFIELHFYSPAKCVKLFVWAQLLVWLSLKGCFKSTLLFGS